MSQPPPQSRRKLSEHRISAYECCVEGSAVMKGKRVTAWYGMFDELRLIHDIVPKLSEYARHGASYPFVVTSHTLEGKTDVWVVPPGQQDQARDVKFRPRRRRTAQQNKAVVYSPTRYELLQ